MFKKYVLKITFILLLSFGATKAFSYEIITGLGYGSSSHQGTSSNTLTASVEAYVPLWFDGFKVGVGTSYYGANLGSKTSLASSLYPVYSPVEEGDVNVTLIPVYVGAKYEYSFNKNFGTFVSARYGISLGNKSYYEGRAYYEDEDTGEFRTSVDSLEMYGNMMYGVSVGMSFFNHYMLSVNYENMAVKNIYHITRLPIGDRAHITQVETVSLKLSYAFRE